MPSWLSPLPWAWFTDPLWLVIGNFLFWPIVFLYVWASDRIEGARRRRRFRKSLAA